MPLTSENAIHISGTRTPSRSKQIIFIAKYLHQFIIRLQIQPDSVDFSVHGDNGKDSAADDILILKLIHIALIKMIRLQICPADRSSNSVKTAFF